MRRQIIAGALAVAAVATTALTPIAPAQAQMAVVDVRAIAQQLKAVQQGLQQLQQLQQQTANSQSMLQKLGSNISPELGSIVGDATSIMKSAQGIGYSAKSVTSQMDSMYPKSMLGMSWDQIASATTAMSNASRQTRQEAFEAQNAIVDSQTRTQNAVSGAVSASQAAAGQTAALQATNQLLAALSTQLTGLQTLLLTQMRAAQSIDAQNAALAAAGRAGTKTGLGNQTRTADGTLKW